MNDMYHNLTSFLAIWFRNLQKSTYNVNVVNKEVDKISPLLYEKLQAIQFLLQDLQGKELKVKVSNQKELNTKDLEDKLTALLSGVKGIKLDNGAVERLLSDLISLSKGIKKVEVLNQPAMPSHMSVAGKVEVSNLPKVQEVKGDFNLKESGDILNALKELATEIRDLKLESIQGYKNMGSTFIGSTGSREAHKLTDGTKTATITTSGDSNALDVNIVAGGAGNGSILDGADTAIKATVKDLTNANPLTVAIVDTSGDQIASFGGGTQYTEGDTDATITGTAFLWEDGANTLATVSAANPLPVLASIDTTGLATAAGQTTIIGHVDGIETLLGTMDADTSNLSTKIDTIAGDTTSIQAALETVGGLVVNLGTNNDVTVTGTVDLGATDNAVLDAIAASVAASSITGIGHGVTTVTTAGTDVALAASTTCKRVVIQAQTDNTSIIAAGASGVDATVATGTGVVLYPGDTFELDIDNLADIYIDSLVNGEGVRYTYFT